MREVTLLGPRGLTLHAAVPQTRRERRRGLLGKAELPADEAMLFERCRSVHTFGMRFEISAVLLDEALRVRRVALLRPGRVLLPRLRAGHVLECAPRVPLRAGDRLTALPKVPRSAGR